MVRSLVTGATGFIGRPLVRQLLERGDAVRVLARPSSDLSCLEGLPVEVVHGDVTAPESLGPALRDVQRVFHAAGMVSFVRRDLPRMTTVNVDGTRNVLSAALRAGVERVVYTSSVSAVAYARQPLPVTESAIWRDFGITYARSKREAEDVAFGLSRQGLPLVVVNPTTAMGPNDPNLTSTAPVARFLSGDLRVRVRGGLNVIDVEDFAAGHVLADERGRLGERYILGGTNLSWRQLFEVLSELSGRPMPREVPVPLALAMAWLMENVVAPRFGRPPKFHLEEVRAASLYRLADSTKAIRELGLPQHPVRDTLARTVEWLQRENPLARGH